MCQTRLLRNILLGFFITVLTTRLSLGESDNSRSKRQDVTMWDSGMLAGGSKEMWGTNNKPLNEYVSFMPIQSSQDLYVRNGDLKPKVDELAKLLDYARTRRSQLTHWSAKRGDQAALIDALSHLDQFNMDVRKIQDQLVRGLNVPQLLDDWNNLVVGMSQNGLDSLIRQTQEYRMTNTASANHHWSKNIFTVFTAAVILICFAV